jgi:chitinase
MPPRLIAYLPGGSAFSGAYPVASIPAEKLTHIIYASVRLDADGNVWLPHPTENARYTTLADAPPKLRAIFTDLHALRADHPHLRLAMLVGGAIHHSDPFPAMSANPSARVRFVESAIALLQALDLDGIDIDWEFPGGGGPPVGSTQGCPADTANLTRLMADLRAGLDAAGTAAGRRYDLTMAAPPYAAQITQIDLPALHPHMDMISIMGYDLRGSWSPTTGFNAPLYAPAPGHLSSHDAVQAYLAGGVPAGKLTLGMPLYGRVWTGVPAVGEGFDQPFADAPLWGQDMPALLAEYGLADIHWHDVAQVPWRYDAARQAFVSHEDADSLRHKVAYARQHDLGGVMVFALGLDGPGQPLLDAVWGALGYPLNS